MTQSIRKARGTIAHAGHCRQPGMKICFEHNLRYCGCLTGGRCPSCTNNQPRGETTNEHRNGK